MFEGFLNKLEIIVKRYSTFIIACILFLAGLFLSFEKPNVALEAVFFDVGQGDAILVKTCCQKILIDGGPDLSLAASLGNYLSYWDRTIDYMILTHPHADHVAGLNEVLNRYRVKRILLTRAVSDSGAWQAFASALRENHLVEYIQQPAARELDGGVIMKFLYPDWSFKPAGADLNDTSMVVKISYGDFDFLFTGDAGAEVESHLLKENADLESEVIKIAHHGSRSASSPAFLEAVHPRYAIISVGKNSYGHPHRRVLKRLEELGIQYFRTDEDGDIILRVK